MWVPKVSDDGPMTPSTIACANWIGPEDVTAGLALKTRLAPVIVPLIFPPPVPVCQLKSIDWGPARLAKVGYSVVTQ